MIAPPILDPKHKLSDGRDFNYVCWTCKRDLRKVDETNEGRDLYACGSNCLQIYNVKFRMECLGCHKPRWVWSDNKETICMGCYLKNLDLTSIK